MGATTIEWTDATWNPVRGCTKISPGCKNCYASAFAERFRGVLGHPYEQGFDLTLVPHKLAEPFLWSKQSFVFVNSMSDLFHPQIADEYIVRVAEVMKEANWHTYQVLTKRADRLNALLKTKLKFIADESHVWWGVSVEDKKHGVPRIAALSSSGAAMKFLSIEPLLEDLGALRLDKIDWVIVGGESGNGSRPIAPEWVRSIREQCEDRAVPFFFKQWGGVQKKKNGRELDGVHHDGRPEVKRNQMPDRNRRKVMASKVDPLAIVMSN